MPLTETTLNSHPEGGFSVVYINFHIKSKSENFR